MAIELQYDFLSENTRKIRRGLLFSCLLGFSISQVGLVIKKINVFGTEIAITRFEEIPFIMGLVALYFLVTFISYSFEEYSAGYKQWRLWYVDQIESGKLMSVGQVDEALIEEESQIERDKLRRLKEFFQSDRRSFFERFRFKHLRTIMEVFLPITIGIYTIILLLFFTLTVEKINAPEVNTETPTVEKIQKGKKQPKISLPQKHQKDETKK